MEEGGSDEGELLCLRLHLERNVENEKGVLGIVQ